jgi:thymidylate synthase
MSKIEQQYLNLLKDILENGTRKNDRTGTGTISVFGRQLRHDFRDGFPLLTTKRMPFKTIVTELLWFLRGDTNIKFLVDNDCHIWDGDAYKNYILKEGSKIGEYGVRPILLTQEEFINKIKTDDEFAKKWGELGPIYGKQWRSWKIGERKLRWSQLSEEQKQTVSKETLENTHYDVAFFDEERGNDQIANLINDLKTNPDSRRLMVNSWNVGELDSMVLPPCHYGFQVYTRELSVVDRIDLASKKYDNFDIMDFGIPFTCTHEDIDEYYPVPRRAISLMWNQRSVDTFLGLPFNIASYGLLLEIIAKAVNMVPDELIGNLGDVHLYSNHVEQAKEQIGRELSLDEIKKIYVDWTLSKSCGGYAGDIKADTINFTNQIFVEGWQNSKDPFTGKHLIELECFALNPIRTREPYPLPTLKHMKTDDFYKSLSEDVSLVTHLNNTDFTVENYQSHPKISAPLSN